MRGASRGGQVMIKALLEVFVGALQYMNRGDITRAVAITYGQLLLGLYVWGYDINVVTSTYTYTGWVTMNGVMSYFNMLSM